MAVAVNEVKLKKIVSQQSQQTLNILKLSLYDHVSDRVKALALCLMITCQKLQ